MEEYLVKAKRLGNEEWVQGYLYGIWEKRYVLWGMTNDIPDMIEVDPSTICRCTGLKETDNDKLIWENDIVLIKSDYPTLKKGVVKYHAPKYLLNIHDEYSYNHDLIDSKEVNTGREHYYIHFKYEVIGNIFDNPELLEGGE